MHSVLDRVEADPARLEWLDQRLAIYQRLRRKYAPTVAEVLEILRESKERLRSLETRGEQLAQIEKEKAGLLKMLVTRGEAARVKRAPAGKLAEAVTRELARWASTTRSPVELRRPSPLSGIGRVDSTSPPA